MTDELSPLVREVGATRQAAEDPGRRPGPPILIVHGGMSDESPWLRVADVLAERRRVVLIRRRLYRLDVPVDVRTAMAEQVDEVLEVAAGFGEPCVVVGHSSGAIVALEALTLDQGPGSEEGLGSGQGQGPGRFAGAVLYEPPTPLPGLPLGEPTTLARARAQLDQGRVGGALRIFLREGVRVPALAGIVAPALALLPAIRPYVARQIDDLDTILRLGDRSAAYATVATPAWLLTGDRSPAHLEQRCDQLTRLLPNAQLVRLPGTGHGANQSHPRQLGELIADLVERC